MRAPSSPRSPRAPRAGEWQGLADFAALLENLLQHRARPAARNPVQVMTIHRAKGLEFEHVFVPALDRAHARRRAARCCAGSTCRREAGASELLIAPAPAVGPQGGRRARCLPAATSCAGARAHERKRLLYVAADARARARCGSPGRPPLDAQGRRASRPHSLLGALWPVLAERFVLEAHRPRRSGRAPPPLLTAPDARVAAAGCCRPASPLHAPAGRAPAQRAPGVQLGGRDAAARRHPGARLARAPGGRGRAGRLPAALDARARSRRCTAARASVYRRARARAPRRRCSRALTQTLADERGRWILDPAHREAHAELALSGRERRTAARRSSSIAPSSMRTGTRWVIDFKTSRHEGAGREAFLDEEVDALPRAAGHLRASSRGRSGPQPVRAALYFPLLQAFRELAP